MTTVRPIVERVERGSAGESSASPPVDEDGRLMERYRDGDAAAFEILLRKHQGPVFRFLLRQLGDATTAEDLAQDTFVRVVHGRASFRTGARFTTWVYTIARNLAIDEMRRRKHRRHRSLDEPTRTHDGEDGRRFGDVVSDPEAKTDMSAADGETRSAIERALAVLPEEQREVFMLREMGDLQFEEIAEVVGCNPNTVKSRMRYALERLRAAIEPLKEGEEG